MSEAPVTAGIPARRRAPLAGHPFATNTGLLLFGVLMFMLARAGVGEFHHYVHGYGADIFGQSILYLGAIALVERCRANRSTLGIILGVALAVRLVCVFAPPFLSTDIYRYVWDGEVQAEGINPYRYIPAAPELSFLRDDHIYPNINRKDYAHTIYPPGAQAIFLAVTRISATVAFMKLAMVGFEAVTCLFLLRILGALGLPRERIVLYAWHPICFWEIASSGHVDAAALAFIALALYARLRARPGQTGGWLGAAVLVKLYPLALLPALLPAPPPANASAGAARSIGLLALARQTRARILRLFGALLGLVLVGYACYASVGAGVFGFLPAYAKEEGIESGTRYFLPAWAQRTFHLPLGAESSAIAYPLLCAVVLLVISVWAWRYGSGPDIGPTSCRNSPSAAFIFAALVLATAMNLCFSPHYPWYFLWLLPMLTVVPWRPAFYLVLGVNFMLSTPLGATAESIYRMNELLYGGFAALLGWEFAGPRLTPAIADFAARRIPALRKTPDARYSQNGAYLEAREP